MSKVSVQFNNISGTEAVIGQAGQHSIVADRPIGKAGGMGLGFNGAELLALAIGGCFCNDLRYVAHHHGIRIEDLVAKVTLTLEGVPTVATSAEMVITCVTSDGSDPARIVNEAKRSCMVSNSISQCVPVSVSVSA